MGAAERRGGAPGFETGVAVVDGQPLHYAARPGPATRPPLLMINGIGANLELALPFLTQLRETGWIIFDAPGVGGSPLPAFPYQPAAMARWGKGLAERLGNRVVDLLGFSWGGIIAQTYAHLYPAACRRLVLAATTPGWPSFPARPAALSRLAQLHRHTDPRFLAEAGADLYGGDVRGAEDVERHAAALKPQSQEGYALQLLCLAGWTSLPWLWSLRQLTLIMAGTEDPLVPAANARLLHSMIPQSRLRLVRNGHLFLTTRPQESAAAIEAFLSAADPMEEA